jgi:hypothetical protein
MLSQASDSANPLCAMLTPAPSPGALSLGGWECQQPLAWRAVIFRSLMTGRMMGVGHLVLQKTEVTQGVAVGSQNPLVSI